MTSYTYIFSPGKQKQSLYRQHQQLADCAQFSSQTDQQTADSSTLCQTAENVGPQFFHTKRQKNPPSRNTGFCMLRFRFNMNFSFISRPLFAKF
jgi:hypothetical protein